MGVSFQELREVCQRPVAAGNDVAGLLFGDRLSLPFTKLFVDLGLSPNVATVGMLVCGLVGSGLQLMTESLALLGAAVLVLYYLLDCVDGEVARWRRVEHARWGYYEYIFHFVVKPFVFASVGVACWLQTGSVWMLAAAFSAAVSTLWLKLFFAVPSLVFVGSVLRDGASGDRPYRQYLEDAARCLAEQVETVSERGGAPDEVFRLGFDRVTLRSLTTNFDVGLALLVLVSALDLVLEPFALFELQGMTCRALWLCFYGVLLPLDFIDYLRSYIGRRHFDQSMVRLLIYAHGFAVAPNAGPARPEAERPAADPVEEQHNAD
jgi:hypothetical protein